MATEPLNPSVTPLFQPRYAENTSGIIAVITACIQAAGGQVTSYPANTAGIIQALIDLQNAIGGGSGAQSVAALNPAIAGEALSVGDAVYIQASDGRVYKAYSNNSREKANVLGLAKESVSNAGDQVTIVARGPIAGLSGLSVGLIIFWTTEELSPLRLPQVVAFIRSQSDKRLAQRRLMSNLVNLSIPLNDSQVPACPC